jgi:methylmalonyl-CoA mutase cobalamin-binding domain/chain
VLRELEAAGASVPVAVGGIIPPGDEAALREAGVARVYTPTSLSSLHAGRHGGGSTRSVDISDAS